MATENQHQLVKDIEAAISAIKLKNPVQPPDGLTITEVCELAERNPVEVRSVAFRLSDNGETELLTRLHDAFMSVNLAPKYLSQALGKLSSNVTPILKVQKPAFETREIPRAVAQDSTRSIDLEAKSVVNGGTFEPGIMLIQPPARPSFNDGEVVHQIIQMLDPLPEKRQHRIIASISAYCGVGL